MAFRARSRTPVGATFVAAILAVAASCALTTQPTPAPVAPGGAASSGPLVLGIDWGRAPSVERPVNYEATEPPDDLRMHPILRIPGQAMMADVSVLTGGGLVAVGYVPPDWYATRSEERRVGKECRL